MSIIRYHINTKKSSPGKEALEFFGVPILDTKWIFCPPLWKLFNSYDFEELPEKEWIEWAAQEEASDGDGEGAPFNGRHGPFAAVVSFFSRLFFLPDEEEELFAEEGEEILDSSPSGVWPDPPFETPSQE